ncbi:hypothetical protein P8452_69252 [Trifolium repens]|nr:hypothetical protein P8452_69252 [Trifolium repens]
MRNAECQLAMNVLWTRLSETGKDWRYVYKFVVDRVFFPAELNEVLTRELAEDGYSWQKRQRAEYLRHRGRVWLCVGE